MKNTIILSTLLIIGLAIPCLAKDSKDNQLPPPMPKCDCGCHQKEMKKPFTKQEMEKKRIEFETRLNLTDEQKTKARELRDQGKTEMKPIMDSIMAKHKELRTAEANGAKEEDIQKIKNDVQELNKKAHETKMQNMKKFENMLNKKQLKELNKMKEEGRKKFEQEHKNKKCDCKCNCHKGEKEGLLFPPMPPKK